MLFRNISIDENFPLKVFINNFYDDFLESSIDLTVRTAATNLDVTITRAHEGYPPEQSRGCLPFICRHKPSQAKKRTRRPETGIKDGFEESCLEHSVRENRTIFSDVPLLPENFRWNGPKKWFVPLFSDLTFRNFFVNGKQPG